MTDGRRSGRHHKMPIRFGLTAIDQCVSSLSNFAVGVGVARVAGVAGFGAYSLAYAGWLVVAAMHRSLITDPMSIENDIHQPDAARHIRIGLAAELTLGLGAAVVFAGIGAALLALGQRQFGICFIGLAPWLPVLLAQDYWRWIGFMQSKPQKALANDVVFVIIQIAAFVGLYLAGIHSALLAIFAWGAGALAGALFGLWQFSTWPALRGGFTRIRERWGLSKWIAAVNAMAQATYEATPVLTSGFLGPVGIGGLKAANSLVSGPSLVLIQAGGSIGLPEATKALKNRGWPGLRRVERIVTVAGLFSVGLIALTIFLFGQTLLVHIYGKAFGQFATVADILAVSVLVAAGGLGAILSLKATRKAQRMVPVSAVSLVVSIVATIVLVQRFGITGAAVATLVGTATMTVGLLIVHGVTSKRAAEQLSAGGTLMAEEPVPVALDPAPDHAPEQDQGRTGERLGHHDGNHPNGNHPNGNGGGGRIRPTVVTGTTVRLPTRPFVPTLDLSIPARPTGGTAPMKILVVHNRYRSSSPSGEDRVVDQEHAALVDAGHIVRRFELFSDDIATFSAARKALVPAEVVWNPKSGRDIVPVLDEFQPDVVHVHNLFPLLSPAVLTACQRRGVPTVVTLHNYRLICPGGSLFRDGAACRDCVGLKVPLPGVQHGCYRGSSAATLPIATATTTQRPIWRSAPSAYIFLSDAQRREMESMAFPLDRCFVKPNLVLPAPPRGEAEPLVVYAGRFTEAKGVHVLMRAWDRFLERRPATTLRLAFAGSGSLEDTLRSWASTRPSVDVVGLLDREACAALVRRARAAVAPSEWPEPFGLVVPEAMAAGVAPIATAHGSFVDMIADGVDGLLYPPGDATALARIFDVVEDDPVSLDQLGQEARRTYERRFHPTKNIAELETIYRYAIDHPRRRNRTRSGGWGLADLVNPQSASTVSIMADVSDRPSGSNVPGALNGSNGQDGSNGQNGPARRNGSSEPNGPSGTGGSGNRGGSTSVPAPTPISGEHGSAASEASIAAFWESHPCGDEMIGGLSDRYRQDYERFFDDYDELRYGMESHIPGCLDRLDLKGKRVLEIGLGQGAESEQLIRRGAIWTGLDVTEESVQRVRTRLELRGLPYAEIIRGSVVDIPVADNSFDLVFSHGVLHHVPDILSAQREIHRVLRPDGRLVAMLYARNSLNYWVSIATLRRLALLSAAPLRRRPDGILGDHLDNARREGFSNYLRLERFTHANTDGPKNPFARVYDQARVEQDFPSFRIVQSRKWFMHAPPLPVHGLPGGRYLGWHLWVELAPRPDASLAGRETAVPGTVREIPATGRR